MAHDLVESDNVDVEVFISGNSWEVVDAEVVLTERSTPDYVVAVITPSPGTSYPKEPSNPDKGEYMLGEEFHLSVDNQLRAGEGREINRIFTGVVANMTGRGDYTYEAIAHDPSQEPFGKGVVSGGDASSFMNSTINIAPGSPRIPRQLDSGYYSQSYEPGDRWIKVKELMGMVLDEANVPNTRREINIAEGGTWQDKGKNPKIRFSEWEHTVEELLDRACNASNSDWWFDRYGQFHFGPRIPDEDIFAYSLEYITDASDGVTTPPYRGVKVIGDGVSSEEGWSKSALINETPMTASQPVVETSSSALAEPVFTYRNMEINTKEEAQTTAKSIAEDLRKQTGTGSVTVIGFPEIRPMDAVVMPNSDRQPMGGTRYSVLEVTHRLNSSDGFITKLGLGGPTKAQEVLVGDEDMSSLQGELEAQWRELGGGGGRGHLTQG